MARTAQELPKFGEEALALGFIRSRDIKKGLQVQGYREARGLPIPLIGEALKELGLMTQEQIEETFSSLCFKSTQEPVKRSWWARLRGA